MNRLADFFGSFCVALFLHGVLVIGAVWFWTLRPLERRPVFQSGDVSLAVTFVAAAADKGQPNEDAGRLMPDASLKKATDEFVEPMPEEGEGQDLPDAESATPLSAPVSANVPADGGRATEKANIQYPAANAQRRIEDQAAESVSDALNPGVSSTVRMQSEIRPYYPLGARLRGEEGAVTVRVLVNGLGRASRCEVVHSSGYPALDESALDAARRARYVSTRPGVWSAESATTLTFRFRLTE